MNILKGLVFVLVIACITTPAMAEDDPVILHVGGWSHHWGFSDNITNENHKVLGVEYKGVAAGYFENSYGRDTAFLLKTWRWDWKYDIEFSTALGVNYGYVECYGNSGDSSQVCVDGYVSAGYRKDALTLTFKVKPGVIIFAPEIHF